MKTLVCIGDSLVEGEGDELSLGGWPGRVARKLTPNLGRNADGWQVYNLGIGGNSIKDIEARLGEVLVRNPDIVVLGCGANDIMGADARGKAMLADYQTIWARVLGKLKAVASQVVVMFGFYAQTEAYADNWRAEYGSMYAEHESLIMSLCKRMDIPFVQLSKDFAAPDVLSDGLHYNAKGYDVVAQLVVEILKDENRI